MSERKVVVTTSHRGVFFGTIEETNGTTVILRECRNCLYWSASVRGFLGLASSGPQKGSRIGPAAPRCELRDVTSITDCTPKAIEAWEASQWEI